MVGLDVPREGELVEGIEDDPELGVEGVELPLLELELLGVDPELLGVELDELVEPEDEVLDEGAEVVVVGVVWDPEVVYEAVPEG